MHSSKELASDMFCIEVAGRRVASAAELIPGFTAQDRLGVVIREPLGAVWNSALILALVTAFYDKQRALNPDFFIYPDYYIFHTGCSLGMYSMFDVWPDHKWVAVEDEAEALLRAINDRGITALVLPEREPRAGPLQRQTVSSALGRLKVAWVCRPDERIEAADVCVIGNPVVENYVAHVLHHTLTVPETERQAIGARRRASCAAGPIIEAYRRVTPVEALSFL